MVLTPSSRALELGLAGFAPAPDFAGSGTFCTVTTERPSDDDGPGFVATTQVLTRWQAGLETLTASRSRLPCWTTGPDIGLILSSVVPVPPGAPPSP